MSLKRLRNTCFTAIFLMAGFIAGCGPRITGGVIGSAVTPIGEQWTSIPLSHPAVAKWDVQLIYLTVSPKFRPSFAPLGIQEDDGSIITPEVKLINKAGQEQQFRLSALINGEELVFRNDQIARRSTFSEIRIRSPKPLVCSRISWISFMPQDTKYGLQ
jgi:hypothetical protein